MIPQTAPIVALFLGAMFLLVAITGGKIDTLWIDVEVTKVPWALRMVAFFVGLGLLLFGMGFSPWSNGLVSGASGDTADPQPALADDTSSAKSSAKSSSPEPTTPPAEDNTRSTAVLVDAVEDYYEAVDRGEWAYTYDHLDSRTRGMFAYTEWVQKNEYLAGGLELSSMNVQVNDPTSNLEVSVTVHRTFKDGTTIDRYTYFVYEDAGWKHRFSQEEIDLFMPGVPYDEFVAAQR